MTTETLTAEQIAAYAVDRTGWGAGPWEGEPDRVDFDHAGLPCMLIRNRLGAWCGYAGVAPGHPWHRGRVHEGEGPEREILGSMKFRQPAYGRCTVRPACPDESYCRHTPEWLLHVHGGVTFSGACGGPICHVPKPGQPDNIFWFGFDCAHHMDVAPGMEASLRDLRAKNPDLDESHKRIEEMYDAGHMPRDVYRDVEYVRMQTESLAEQLAAVRPGDHMRMRFARMARRIAAVAER